MYDSRLESEQFTFIYNWPQVSKSELIHQVPVMKQDTNEEGRDVKANGIIKWLNRKIYDT